MEEAQVVAVGWEGRRRGGRAGVQAGHRQAPTPRPVGGALELHQGLQVLVTLSGYVEGGHPGHAAGGGWRWELAEDWQRLAHWARCARGGSGLWGGCWHPRGLVV